MALEQALKDLGLTPRQAAMYTALLQTGPTTAYNVALRSGLKRPTVYINLEELRMRGLVNKIPKAQKTLYVARNPEELVQEAQEKLARAKEALPALQALMSKGKRPQALFYEGPEGLKQALLYGLKQMGGKELVGWYAQVGDLPKHVREDLFSEINSTMNKLAVGARGFAPKHPSLKRFRELDKQFGRQIKQIPASEYASNISIDVGDDFVRLIAYKDLQAVIIKNADIALALRQVFEIMWQCR
jgi:sugar-specific transcriptional regulator TrmB